MNTRVDVIGYPFDLGGPLRGSALGPQALRYAGLVRELQSLGVQVQDLGDLPLDSLPTLDSTRGSFDRLFEEVVHAGEVLHQAVRSSLDSGAVPLVLGGDHSLSTASVGAALAVHGSELGLLWIDAHADMNTPSSTPSQNMHGMSIGAMAHLPCNDVTRQERWDRWLQVAPVPMDLQRVGWIGLRDVDPGEAANMASVSRTAIFDMQRVDILGIPQVACDVVGWLNQAGIKKLWISFDVDVLDPVLAPGTGTTVFGGLTFREAHLLAELLHEGIASAEIELVGLDLVEVNPLLDLKNETAKMGVGWLSSLFGKTIFPRR